MKTPSPHQLITPLLLSVSLTLVVACQKKQPVTQGTPQMAAPPASLPEQQHTASGGTAPVGQTKYFKGSIGSTLGLQMKLARDGERLSGTYFYQKVGTKIDLKGTIDKDGSLTLEEFDANGKQTGIFKGQWESDNEDGLASIAGNWSKPNGDKKTAFSLHEEPIEFTSGVEIVAKQVKEANKNLKYEIDVEYPQVGGTTDTRFDKFNKEAKSFAIKKVSGFRKEMAKSSEDETPGESEQSSDLGIGYIVSLARDDLVSIEFSIGSYCRGAAHPNSFTEVLNYDVKAGKVLKLDDLFKPGSKYLQTISSYCIKDLKKQSKVRGPDSMLEDDTIESGAAADAKNYQNWRISRKGLGISFDPNQIAPYAAGPQSVFVPYSALKQIIRPDGPVGQFVDK